MKDFRHSRDALVDGGSGHTGEFRKRFGLTFVLGAVRNLSSDRRRPSRPLRAIVGWLDFQTGEEVQHPLPVMLPDSSQQPLVVYFGAAISTSVPD